MDRIVKRHKLLKLKENQKYLSKSITIVTKKLSTEKNLESFNIEFYQMFREELIPSFHKFFQNIEKKGTLPTLFHEVRITLLLKPDKDIAIHYRLINL